MLTTKNVNVTLVRVMIIPMRKPRLRVMLLTAAAKAAQKQNINARKTPAPVTQLANAAEKSVLPSVTAALLKSLRVVKPVILVPVIMSVAGHGNIALVLHVLQIVLDVAFIVKAIIFLTVVQVLPIATEFIVTVTVPVVVLILAVVIAAEALLYTEIPVVQKLLAVLVVNCLTVVSKYVLIQNILVHLMVVLLIPFMIVVDHPLLFMKIAVLKL